MILDDILNEGLIKLPQQALDQMVKFTVRYYLAYYLNYCDENLTGKDYHEAKQLCNKIAKKHGVEVTEKDQSYIETNPIARLVVQIEPSDFPQEYMRKMIPKVYENDSLFLSAVKTKLTFYVDFLKPESRVIGNYHSTSQVINMFINSGKLSDKNLIDQEDRERTLTQSLPRFLGTLEHELTHAMQFLVLKQFHKKQVKYNQGDDLKAYATSDVEFDPAIKTCIAIFKTISKKMQNIDPNWDQEAALRFFVAADGDRELTQGEIEKIGFTKRTPFFAILKKSAPVKYKKAVKLFYQGIKE